MNDNTVMSVKNVSVKYKGANDSAETLALENVNLDVNDGDFVCILGPSGCGKSTLLNVMGGLLEATEGSVEMLGEAVRGVDPKRAIVFQQPTLYPWMDVYSNIAFGPNVRGIKSEETDRRTKEYIELVGLEDFAHSKPYELSGGMRQRAALARALVNDPVLILLDEPFGALDAFTRTTMQDLIRKVWKSTKCSAVMITHDVDEALSLATRVITMSALPGTIIKEFDVNFTNYAEDSEEDFRYTKEYLDLRREVLHLIKQK